MSGIRTWHHGHSWFTTPGCGHAQFACLDCGKELGILDHSGEVQNHCWDCMAKFCDECWGVLGMRHDEIHHRQIVGPKRVFLNGQV